MVRFFVEEKTGGIISPPWVEPHFLSALCDKSYAVMTISNTTPSKRPQEKIAPSPFYGQTDVSQCLTMGTALGEEVGVSKRAGDGGAHPSLVSKIV
jgi:hypothetical protein